MTLVFTETVMADEPASDSNADASGVPSGWEDLAPVRDADTCVIAGCNNPRKPYGGRGKHPTRCVEHSAPGQRGGVVAGAPREDKWAVNLEAQLNAAMLGLGMVVARFDQFDGQTIVTGAPPFTAALVAQAKADPKFRKWLESIVKGNNSIAILIAAGGIVVPILAHHRMIPNLVNAPLTEPKPAKSREQKAKVSGE